MTELPSGNFVDLNEVLALIYTARTNRFVEAVLVIRNANQNVVLSDERDTLFVRNFLREKGKNEPR